MPALLLLLLSVGALVGLVLFARSRRRLVAVGRAEEARALAEITAQCAIDLRHASMRPAHFLLAVTLDPRAQRTLRAGGIDPSRLRGACDGLIERLAIPRHPEGQDLSVDAQRIAGEWMGPFLRRALARDRTTIPLC